MTLSRKSKKKSNFNVLSFINLILTIILSLVVGTTLVTTFTRADAPSLGFTQKQSTFGFTPQKEAAQPISTEPDETCKADSHVTGKTCKCLSYEWEVYSCKDGPGELNNYLTKNHLEHFLTYCNVADTGHFVGKDLCKRVLHLKEARRISEAVFTQHKNDPSCKRWCIGKPVIYLYPEQITAVDVKLDIPGRIYESIPHYPPDGWKNVIAHPDGTLYYQGNRYHELYYEDELDEAPTTPENGIIIATTDLKPELLRITAQLGLRQAEQKEFLEYWIPKLTALNKPYILFSVFNEAEKERIDTVHISPPPDTFIAFIAYFKGLDLNTNITPLLLPEQPPARIGFTAVEWGGVIAP